VLVLGPPLRVEPLLAARSPWTMLSFSDDPDESGIADVVVLTEPTPRDVVHVRRLAGQAMLVALLRRDADCARTTRLLAAGADVCLVDPDAPELAPHFRGPTACAPGAEPTG
jgi:hypothetical protein